MNTKAEIRQKYKLLRKSFSENEIDRLSLNLAKVITDNFQLKNNKISVFLSIKKLNEINTQFIINELKKQNSIAIDISKYPVGLYFVSLKSSDGLLTKKVVFE